MMLQTVLLNLLLSLSSSWLVCSRVGGMAWKAGVQLGVWSQMLREALLLDLLFFMQDVTELSLPNFHSEMYDTKNVSWWPNRMVASEEDR